MTPGEDGDGPAQVNELTEAVVSEKKVTFVLPGEEDGAEKKKVVKFGD